MQMEEPVYKEYKDQSYLDEFLSMKCCGDILNVLNPVQGLKKEISESMAVIKRLRKVLIKNPNKYILYDLCAGNALASVTATHLFKTKHTYAVDIKKRDRKWENIREFTYINKNIHDDDMCNKIKSNSIIISVHPCSELASRVVEIYNQSRADFLVLMSCCEGSVDINVPQIIRDKIGKYLIWSWNLASMCKGRVNMVIDDKCLSPKNCLIIAKKK